jgi:hypothetical protein
MGLERAAFKKLRGKVEHPVRFARIVHPEDVRMLEQREQSSLFAKPLQKLLRGSPDRVHHFECDPAS